MYVICGTRDVKEGHERGSKKRKEHRIKPKNVEGREGKEEKITKEQCKGTSVAI